MDNTEKTLPHTRLSFAVTSEMKLAIEKIASTENISTAQLIRKYIEQGMNVDKTKNDIDFIRKNIREEVEIIMKKHTNRTLSLLYKIGMYVIPQSLFTAEIVHKIFRLKDNDKADFAQMWERSKTETAIVLHTRDLTIEKLYDEHYGNYK